MVFMNKIKENNKVHYLIFRRCEDNYYIEENRAELVDDKTPANSLVCEINRMWEQVVSDKLHLSILPKKLPAYIIEGFRTRLEKDIKRSLYNEYKILEEQNMGYLFNNENEIFLKSKFCEAKDELVNGMKSISKIEEFFAFSIAIQEVGAIKMYETKMLDIFKV